jgi:hypothetical protein
MKPFSGCNLKGVLHNKVMLDYNGKIYSAKITLVLETEFISFEIYVFSPAIVTRSCM